MNGIVNFWISLSTVIFLGVICAFLIYLDSIKEEIWEPIWESLKSEDYEK